MVKIELFRIILKDMELIREHVDGLYFMRDVLKQGKVPDFTGSEKLIQRKYVADSVGNILRELAFQNMEYPLRILVVHGMPGSGKTILASEALKSNCLIEQCFPNGVIWVDLERHRSPVESASEIRKCFYQILSYHFLYRPEKTEDQSNISNVHLLEKLKEMFENRRILLGFDGLRRSDVLEIFEGIPVVIMVTTRNKAIANDIKNKELHFVDAMTFPIDEARLLAEQLFQQDTSTQQDDLINILFSRYGSLPQTIVVAAKILRERKADKYWELLAPTSSAQHDVILNAAIESKSPKIITLYDSFIQGIWDLIEFCRSDETTGKCSDIQEIDYKKDQCVLGCYLDLAICEDDEKLFDMQFEILWKRSDTSSWKLQPPQDILEQLAERSLLIRTGKSGGPKNQKMYLLHPLQKSFLKMYLKKSPPRFSLEERYKEWLTAYLQSKNMSTIIDDQKANHFRELAHVIRTIEYGGQWRRCFNSFGVLLSQVDELPEVHQELIKDFAKRGDDCGWTALHEACRLDQSLFVSTLLKMDVDINIPTGADKWFPSAFFLKSNTPLHVACAVGNLSTVTNLCQQGADVNAQTDIGWTPLHWAYYLQNLILVDVLIKHHADANAENNAGEKPYDLYSRPGFTKNMKVTNVGNPESFKNNPTIELLTELCNESQTLHCIVSHSTFRIMPLKTFAMDMKLSQLTWTMIENHILPENTEFRVEGEFVSNPASTEAYIIDADDCQTYWTSDITSGKWERKKGPGTKRCRPVAIQHDNKIWLIGGSNQNELLPTVECYDIKRDSWTPMEPLDEPVYKPAVVVDSSGENDTLLVIGGQDKDGKWNNCIQYLCMTDGDRKWESQSGVLTGLLNEPKTEQKETGYKKDMSGAIAASCYDQRIILSLGQQFAFLSRDQVNQRYELGNIRAAPTPWSDSMIILKNFIILVCWERVWAFHLKTYKMIELPPLPLKVEMMRTFVMLSKSVISPTSPKSF